MSGRYWGWQGDDDLKSDGVSLWYFFFLFLSFFLSLFFFFSFLGTNSLFTLRGIYLHTYIHTYIHTI